MLPDHLKDEFRKIQANKQGAHSESKPYIYDRQRGFSRYETDFGPLLEGRRFTEIIQSKLSQKGSCAVLDIACGEGNFLFDIDEAFKEQSVAPHLTGVDYIGRSSLLETKPDINWIKGNLDTVFIPGKFDLIVGNWFFLYTTHPMWNLKRATHWLALGGEAFFHPFDIQFASEIHARKIIEAFTTQPSFELNWKFNDRSGGTNLWMKRTGTGPLLIPMAVDHFNPDRSPLKHQAVYRFRQLQKDDD